MSISKWLFSLVPATLALIAFCGGPNPAQAAPDPTRVIGPDECGECHKEEIEVWHATKHAKTFNSMPSDDKAREIADKLGIRRIKSESLCLNCHFTEVIDAEGKQRAIAGISCESCHGAAADWNEVHSDFGGKDVTAENESEDHKVKRIAASIAGGLIRPAAMVDWASNCFGCHTVPQEKLVNVGGHPAGSAFELVSWSQGEVRHNIWFSGDKSNRDATPERRRVMYVVGRMLDLAFSLRGVAKATEKAGYATAMAKRAKVAAGRLKQIADIVDLAPIAEAMAIAGGVKLRLNNEAELTDAADRMIAAARQVVASEDGSGLAAVDALIPAAVDFKGKPAR